MQNIGRATGRVMQIGAQAQQKVVGKFDTPPIGFAQPVFPHQMRRRQCAFLEVGHPKKILIVAQPAASVFQIWFLHVNAVAKFLVARILILHPHLDVFAFITGDTFSPEVITKLSR